MVLPCIAESAEALAQLQERHREEIDRLSLQSAAAVRRAEDASSEVLEARRDVETAQEELETSKARLRADMKVGFLQCLITGCNIRFLPLLHLLERALKEHGLL